MNVKQYNNHMKSVCRKWLRITFPVLSTFFCSPPIVQNNEKSADEFHFSWPEVESDPLMAVTKAEFFFKGDSFYNFFRKLIAQGQQRHRETNLACTMGH